MAVPFLSGAIEGFYGQPWTHAERIALFDWLAAWGLNTYLYAPKDDLRGLGTFEKNSGTPESLGSEPVP